MFTSLALTTLLALSVPASAAPPRLSAGYFGDFASHPGGYAGVSWTLAEAGPVQALGGAELGAYHHHRNHTGAFARGTFGLRATADSGLFVEPRFVAGYLHTWVDADSFWGVDERTGEIRPAYPGGSPNVTYGASLGGGWDPAAPNAPTVVLRVEGLARAPYNGFALDQFAALVGLEWSFGGGAR